MRKKLLRILIIEDNIDHVELLTQSIERHFAPIDLHTVETIDDALDFIEQTEYDIVFTDCYINNASVLEHIPQLKTKLGENIPIIVITGSGDETLAANVIKNGATEYLVKTKDSLEKIPALINKYIIKSKKPHKVINKSTGEIREKILDEVTNLNQKAKHIASPKAGRIPDLKQVENLLDQIQRLKELASKLMEK